MADKRKLPEDVVEYRLFPSINQNDIKRSLDEFLDSVLASISPFAVDFIWQNEPFSLTTVSEGDCPPHLYGKTNFGDNIEDEWFIVYLLVTLTKQFPGLIVKVNDNDDEFLLIEAADTLPKWITPETAENRVYLYNGELHVIPIPQTPADVTSMPTGTPSISQAVQYIRDHNSVTRAGTKVQQDIAARINEFPNRAIESVHYAHCYIPANLAAVLEAKPSLVSAGVQAFYYRDPIDLRSCRTMQYFRPGTRVMSRVKFTRCLYAQLLQQRFVPDKRCGYTLPSSLNPKFKAHDLGTKLAHGFEILCSKCLADHHSNSNGHISMTNDVRWQRYCNTLKVKGYFKGQMEGSEKYRELLKNAQEFYTQQISHQSSCKSAGDEVLDLLETVSYDIEAMRRAESQLSPPDDEDWLNITPESLEELLTKRSGLHVPRSQQTPDLSEVASSMKTFVDKVSGIDGAEFPEEGEEEIQFDSTGFISAMQKMFEFDDNDDASSSDMDEYGWDDSDIDVDDQPPVVQTEKRKKNLKSSKPSVNDYMDMMDRELSSTKVGKSFEKEAPPKGNTKPTSNKPSGSTEKKKSKGRNINDEDDDFQPVNIDMNVVKNMLQSLDAQAGLAGPASNILNSMNVNIPCVLEEDDTSPEVPPAGTNTRRASQPVPPPRKQYQPLRRTSDPHSGTIPNKPTNLPVPPPRHRTSKPVSTVQRQVSKESNV